MASRPLPYTREISPQDTQRAAEVLTPELVPNEVKPRMIRFSGSCPRCNDPMKVEHPLFLVRGSTDVTREQTDAIMDELDRLGIDRSSGDESVDLECACGIAHPGSPKDSPNCGSRFRIRVVWP